MASAVKKLISDVLAWVGFSALLFSLLSFVVPIVDMSGVVGQVIDTYDEVSNCASQRCEASLNIEGLPNGFGLDNVNGERSGVAVNELTSPGHRDKFAGTPFHKSVAVRLERLES